MRSLSRALLLVCGCGRLAFDPRPIDATNGTDAPTSDGSAAVTPPSFVTSADSANAVMASLSYPVTIGAGANRAMLVSVQIGSYYIPIPDPSVPQVASVTYGGLGLTRIASVLGTPPALNLTRSELWLLLAPPVGVDSVVIQLDATAGTLHSGALSFTGVDQYTPVRSTMTTSGNAAASSVTVASAAGDLVVDYIGQGAMIVAPGAMQTPAYIHNVSNIDTLNNSAASTRLAAAGQTTLTWTFSVADDYQGLAASLRPAP